MDTDILKQNMDADGKQSIHVTPDEAELVRRLEGGRDAERQSGYDFMRTLDYSYDPESPPAGMTDEERRTSRSDEWAWNDIQTLVPTSDRMASPEMFLSNPMSTSGLAYVDDKMNITTDMRGNKTPEHLQRQQDDIVSYLTSERSRNMIEDLRMSMPRKMQDNLSGSMFVEAGRDGTHSLFTGNEETGYTELGFGPDEEGFRAAMDTVKRGFAHADENGDFGMDAGFWGRVTSANDYTGYRDSDLKELFQQGMAEVRAYYQYEPRLAAEAMRVVDQISDEQRRRAGAEGARALGYSRRVVGREIGNRARRIMGQGRL